MRNSGSFRDQAGFVYENSGKVYRKINNDYFEHYEVFVNSGLAKKLIERKMIVNFTEIKNKPDLHLEVEKIPFISYPYEWSFSMLKEAAILTLSIEKLSNQYGLTLKDASAYNVQFINEKPIFIDITSFEKIINSNIWIPYAQFCRHFLAPLALQSKVDISFNKLLQIYLDGIPLNITNKLLPVKYLLNLNLFLHIYLHSKFIKKYEKKSGIKTQQAKGNFKNLIDNLVNTIDQLNYIPKDTQWVKYYEESVENDYLSNKKSIVLKWIEDIRPISLWDLGANNGLFSKLVAKNCDFVLASDIDPASIELLHTDLKLNPNKNILPLIVDISNPPPGIGWMNTERISFLNRVNSEVILALAIIHHLRITCNLPLEYLANFFHETTKYLIIEFVPKNDDKVKFLLKNKKDIYSDYEIDIFENIFLKYFELVFKESISNSNRILYNFKWKSVVQ